MSPREQRFEMAASMVSQILSVNASSPGGAAVEMYDNTVSMQATQEVNQLYIQHPKNKKCIPRRYAALERGRASK
jgi:hypothetical protein